MASSYGTDADKSALRAGYLAARQQIPAPFKVHADRSIGETLLEFPLFAAAPLVLSYVSHGNEVDTRAMIQRVLESAAAWACRWLIPQPGRWRFTRSSP